MTEKKPQDTVEEQATEAVPEKADGNKPPCDHPEMCFWPTCPC